VIGHRRDAVPRPSKDAAGDYRIGTVARLTGLDEHTIRAWEIRHGAVHPRRSAGGTRLYGDADIARLRLLRALTECGDPIGRIAGLDDAKLRTRLVRLRGEANAATRPVVRGRPLRLATVGATLAPSRPASRTARSGIETVLATGTLDAALDRLGAAAPDVLVAHLSVLGPDPVGGARRLRERCDARLTVVVYEFARDTDLAALSAEGVHLARGPLRRAQLERLLLDWISVEREPAHEVPSAAGSDPALEPPPRIFDDAQVARLREIASSVDCECPNHLATLIESLTAFERYASQCAARSPADAQLHGGLRLGTGHARHRMEVLLRALCEADGIEL